MKINVITLFSGYDSQCLGLDRIKESHPDFDYDLIAWAEIDKYAIQAHNLIYPQYADRNLGDVSKIDWKQQIGRQVIDLLTLSFPCQDISAAGKQRGFEDGSGTRSSLLWECERAIDTLRPKVLLMENVKALVSKKFMPYFQKWCEVLEGYGYRNYWQVMNARDYGVPQNRERVFMISKLDDTPFVFPEPFPLELRLKDVLEDHVDEKYYLSDKALEYFNRVNDDDSHGHKFTPKDEDDTAFTVRTRPGSRVDTTSTKIMKQIKVGYVWRSKMNGGVFSPNGISPCLVVGNHSGVAPKIIEYEDIGVPRPRKGIR